MKIFLVFSFLASFIFAGNIIKHKNYIEYKENGLVIKSSINSPERCIHCGEFFKFKEYKCENIPKQSFKKLKTPKEYKTLDNVIIFKEPVNCSNLAIGYINKGEKVQAIGFTKFGWVKIKQGWIKGYKLFPKFVYKCPKCPF